MKMSGKEVEKEDAYRKTTLLTTYKKVKEAGKPVSRGRGFFLHINDPHFICTCAHVLRTFCELWNEGVITSIQAAISDGTPGIESYDGYYIKSINLDDKAWPIDKQNHFDVALLRLKPESVEEIKASKQFITRDLINFELPAQNDQFYYRGYPEAFVEPNIATGKFDETVQEIRAKGRADFLPVQEAYANLIVLNRGKDTVDLQGVSGSALFDNEMHLRGIIWGFHKDLLYALPAKQILDFADQCTNGDLYLSLGCSKVDGSN